MAVLHLVERYGQDAMHMQLRYTYKDSLAMHFPHERHRRFPRREHMYFKCSPERSVLGVDE